MTSSGFQIQSAQPGMILPPSQKQPAPLQWATWSSPHFNTPFLPNLPELLTGCDHFYSPYSTPVEEKTSTA